MQLKALLFDLDGTLVDTAPDMVGSVNRLLRKHGKAEVDYGTASKLVSNGARALLEFGFGTAQSDAVMARLIDEFLSDYQLHIADQSKLYPGIQECLELCQEHSLPWGVVTNKPLSLSRALLDGLDLLTDCKILLGGDSLPVKKPDPAPLLHCCMALHLAASECIYVGDHERDIVAGNAAGMDSAVALWGYIDSSQQPDEWRANYLIREPAGLTKLVRERLSVAQHLST